MFNTLIVFVIQVWVLSALAIGLHALSKRYGVSLILMYAAALASVVTYANPVNVFVEPVPGFLFSLPSDVIIPTILIVVLILYILNGTSVAQLIIFGITLIQLIIAIVFVIISLSVSASNVVTSTLNFTDVLNVDLQLMLAGVLAFVANMLIAAIVYQGIHNQLKRYNVAISTIAALLSALWTDALVFGALSNIGQGGFAEYLPGDLASKTLSGLVVAPVVILYVRHQLHNRSSLTLPRYRPAFDIVNDIFGRLQKRVFQLEAELREQEVDTHQLIQHIDAIYWMADQRDQNAYFVSPAFENISGTSRSRYYLNPESVFENVHEEDLPKVSQRWLTYTRGDTELIFRLNHKDNGLRWLKDRVYHVEDQQLGIDRVIGITEDITAEREREALETQISTEREKINLLHDLLSEYNHDLKSPITSIGLKIDLAKRSHAAPDQQQDYLSQLKQQTHHLERMLEYLFTLMRVEIHGGAYKQEPVSLNALCKEVYLDFQPIASKNNLALQTSLTDEATLVSLHSVDMRRAIDNVVSNAIRYTPAGGSVRIDTQIDEKRVLLIVADTGIGIAEDDLPHIFERTFRAQNARSFDGSGLGLHITMRVVEQHQGHISVESELGVGTTVQIDLPAALS